MVTFVLLLLTTSCNLFFNEPYNDEFIPGNSLETKTIQVDGNGGSIQMSDGTIVEVPSNAITSYTEMTVSKINSEQLFDSEQSLVYDVEFSEVPSSLSMQLQLKSGLTTENVSVVCYDPESADDFPNGLLPEINYDSITGTLICTLNYSNVLKSAYNSKYPQNEMIFKRWVIEWDENVEGSVENLLIDMPYYMQPGGTCVATCGTMLTKAFTPYKDRKNEYEVSDFLKRLQIGKNDGVGPYSFLHTVPTIFHSYTGAGVETTGYFLSSNLQSAMVKQLDSGFPLILRLDFPGEGSHAILVVGYQKIISGSQRSKYNFVFHNPNLTENMYSMKSFDWLMSKKSRVVAYQILYPSNEPHPQRALQTVGFPLNEDGYIQFKLDKGRIFLDYDMNSKTGYNWFDPSKKSYEAIPDNFNSLDLSLPVWNANKTNAEDVELKLTITSGDKVVFKKTTAINLPVNTSPYWFNLSIPKEDFYDSKNQGEHLMLVQLSKKSGQYLDGLLTKFEIDKQEDAGYANLDLGLYGKANYVQQYRDNTNSQVFENNHLVLTYHNMKLTKNGNFYTSNLSELAEDGQVRSGTFKIEVKNKVVKSIQIEDRLKYMINNDTITIVVTLNGKAPFSNDEYLESDYNGIKLYQYSANDKKIFDQFKYSYRKEGLDYEGKLDLTTLDMNELNNSMGAVVLQLTDQTLY